MPRGRPAQPPSSGVPEIDGFLAAFRAAVLRDGLVTVEQLRQELGFGDKNRVTYDLGRRLISLPDVERYLAASRKITGADIAEAAQVRQLHHAACEAASRNGVRIHESPQARTVREKDRTRELAAKLDQAEAELAVLRRTLTSTTTRATESERLVAQLKALLGDVTDQLRDSQRATVTAADDNASLRAEIDQLREHNKRLRDTVAGLQRQLRSQRRGPSPRRQASPTGLRHLTGLLAVLTAGAVSADLFGIPPASGWSPPAAVAALAVVAIYLQTSTVNLREVAGRLLAQVVLLVIAKMALIASVMLTTFVDPAHLVLAVAVASITPVSVVLLHQRQRQAERTRYLALVWISVDGPISMVLAIHVLPALLANHEATVLTDLAINIGFAGAVFVSYQLARLAGTRWLKAHPRLLKVAMLVLLAASVVIASWQSLVLGIAAVGLFLRPDLGTLGRYADRVLAAVVVILAGFSLASGVEVIVGVVLGIAAFAAHAVVGGIVRDTRFALAHLGGSEALLLALMLEPLIPGAVGVIGPAVLVTGGLHLLANKAADAISPTTPGLTRPRLVARPEGLRAM